MIGFSARERLDLHTLCELRGCSHLIEHAEDRVLRFASLQCIPVQVAIDGLWRELFEELEDNDREFDQHGALHASMKRYDALRAFDTEQRDREMQPFRQIAYRYG